DVGMYVYDDDNALAAYLGTAAADGAQLLVRNPDKTGSVINIHAGRWARPLLSAAWQFDPIDADYGAIANGYAEVSSGTYTRCWATFLPITSGGIYSSIVVDRTGTAVVD